MDNIIKAFGILLFIFVVVPCIFLGVPFELIIIICIIIVVLIIIFAIYKHKPEEEKGNNRCEKCGSTDHRYLYDRTLIRTETKQVTVQSGFSNSTRNYSGRSRGTSIGRSGVRLSGSSHSGTSSGHSEHYRIKEVKVKIYSVSCRCNDCGYVWKKIVRDDEDLVSQSKGARQSSNNKKKFKLKNEELKLKKQITELLNVNPNMTSEELAERLEADIASINNVL